MHTTIRRLATELSPVKTFSIYLYLLISRFSPKRFSHEHPIYCTWHRDMKHVFWAFKVSYPCIASLSTAMVLITKDEFIFAVPEEGFHWYARLHHPVMLANETIFLCFLKVSSRPMIMLTGYPWTPRTILPPCFSAISFRQNVICSYMNDSFIPLPCNTLISLHL